MNYYKLNKNVYYEWVEGAEVIDESEYIRITNILNEIEKLKRTLAKTDYRALKYAEGYYTEEEYKPYKTLRQELRDEINHLESQI